MEQPVTSSARSDSVTIRHGIAVAGWLLVSLAQVASLIIWSRTGFAAPGYVFMSGPTAILALHFSLTAQAAAALVLTIRRPENPVGWAVLVFALVTASATPVMTATADTMPAAADATLAWVAWLVSWFVFPTASLLSFFLAFVFPTGHLASATWRPRLAAVVLACCLAAFGIAARDGPLLFFPGIDNPLRLAAGPDARVVTAMVVLLLGASGCVAGAALVDRYRVSDEVMRVQIRWYIASGILLASAYVLFAIALVVLEPTNALGEITETCFFAALGIPPIAITIAILRYRLYDIDTIINRTFVYGALTAVLAGIYTASIRLFNDVFVAVTGESSDAALVITTLLLATSFTPIKRRLEAVAARRFDQRAPQAEVAPVQGDAWMLDDPVFLAALDARIHAALDARASKPRHRS